MDKQFAAYEFLQRRVKELLPYHVPEKPSLNDLDQHFKDYLLREYAEINQALQALEQEDPSNSKQLQMYWLELFTLSVGLLTVGNLEGIEFIFNPKLYLPDEAHISSLKRDVCTLLPFPPELTLQDDAAVKEWFRANQSHLTWDDDQKIFVLK